MGVDWIKFRVRPDVDIDEVRELTALVNRQHLPTVLRDWLPTPRTLSTDDATGSESQQAYDRLEAMISFPRGRLRDSDYWSTTALTDPPGMNLDVAFASKSRVAPNTRDVEACRVYVISHNPVFPIEWREETYRIILP